MQEAIENLMRLGRLPASAGATAAAIQAFESELSNVETPVSDDEALALIKLFGPDDCFGLAWTVLHLIETAPGWPLHDVFDENQGDWIDRLRERLVPRP